MNTLEQTLARCLDRFALVGGHTFDQNQGRDYPTGVLLSPMRSTVGETPRAWRAVIGDYRGDGESAHAAAQALFELLTKACGAMIAYHKSGIAAIDHELGGATSTLETMAAPAGDEITITPQEAARLQQILASLAKLP